MSEADFRREGLLDGVEGDALAARVALLEELHAAGFSIERLKTACQEDRLAFLPVEHALAGEAIYSEAELFDRAGADPEFIRANWQAIGFSLADSEAKLFNDRDVEAARRVARFRDAGLPDDGLLEVARVMGQSMARVADTVRELVGEVFMDAEASERDLGLAYAEVARELTPELGPMLEYILHTHLTQQIRNDVVSRAELVAGRSAPGARQVTVAFADLVGYTRLGTQVDTARLGAVARRLARLASEVAKPPVRLVKTLGDGVMLVSADTNALVRAALELIDATLAEGDEFPDLRAGVAAGPALSRGGDWYGHTVNLAARITGVARPGSVVATRDTRVAAGDEFDWSFIGERRMKGIGKPVRLFRVRPQPAERDDGSDTAHT
jgi:adenylate cyclase